MTRVARTDTHTRLVPQRTSAPCVFLAMVVVAGCGQSAPRTEHPTQPLAAPSAPRAAAPDAPDGGEVAAPTAAPATPTTPAAGDTGASPCRPDSPWQNIDAGEFRFTIPCDMVQKPVAGIDSKVARYESPSLTLMYDYGRYSSDLRDLQGQELREESTTISGKAARIVTVRSADTESERPFTAAVAFASVGPAIRADKVRLTMVAQGKAAADQETAKRIFRSIQFQ